MGLYSFYKASRAYRASAACGVLQLCRVHRAYRAYGVCFTGLESGPVRAKPSSEAMALWREDWASQP